MATFGELKADIADSIDDTTGEYADQIEKAVLKAIRYCERTNYYFNETRDITFPTVDGREWYDAADNENIPTLVRIEAVYSEDAQGQRSIIRPERPEAIELLSDNSAARGEPYCYVYFAQKIRLYPIPGETVYTIRLQVGPYRLAPLEDDEDSNVWTTEAYDMVFERAKFHLAADTLKDAALATASLQLYQDQHDELKRETSKRTGTGNICPTSF